MRRKEIENRSGFRARPLATHVCRGRIPGRICCHLKKIRGVGGEGLTNGCGKLTGGKGNFSDGAARRSPASARERPLIVVASYSVLGTLA